MWGFFFFFSKRIQHLYQVGSGFWWYHAIILPFICWLLHWFSHSYLDYMGFQDFHHCLKCRKTVEMHENDHGRDWDTGISLLQILAFVWRVTVYCYQPYYQSTRGTGSFFHEGMSEWMDGYRIYTLHCWSVTLFLSFQDLILPTPTSPMSECVLFIWLPRKRFNKQPRWGFRLRDAGGGLPCVCFW